MGNRKNQRRPKKRRYGVSKSGSSPSNFKFTQNKTHNTRQSSKRVIQAVRNKIKPPIVNPYIDAFGNSMRRNVYQSKAVQDELRKVSLLTLDRTISKLRGYNTGVGYSVVALECK